MVKRLPKYQTTSKLTITLNILSTVSIYIAQHPIILSTRCHLQTCLRNPNVVDLIRGCRLPLWEAEWMEYPVPPRDSLTQLNFTLWRFMKNGGNFANMAADS